MKKILISILCSVFILSLGAYERGCAMITEDFDPRTEETNNCIGIIRDSTTDNSIKIAVYQFGTIWRDTCRFPNKNWVQVYSNFSLNLTCTGSVNNGDTMFTAGNNGAFLLSSNSGLNWINEPIPAPIQGHIRAASITQKGAIALLNSSSGGSYIRVKAPLFGGSWQLKTLPVSSTINCVKALWSGDANNFSCLAGSDSGKVMYSTNSGTSWISRNIATNKRITFVDMYSQNAWIAGGTDSLLRITTNAGATWLPPAIAVGSWGNWEIKSIEMINDVSGYILAYDGSNTMIRNIAVNFSTGYLAIIDFMNGLGVSGEIKSFTSLPDYMLGTMQGNQYPEGIFYKTNLITAHITQVEMGSDVIDNSYPYSFLPANNSTVISLTPLIKWSEMADCYESEIQVSVDTSFSAPVLAQTVNASNYTIPSGVLSYSTRYYWRARNKHSSGTHNSRWSPVSSFTTPPPAPPAPVLISPFNNSTGIFLQPTLDWNEAANAQFYDVQVSTNSAFTSFVVNEQAINISFYIVPGGVLQNNRQYFWRIRAGNSSGYGPYSSVWNFTTGMVGINPISAEIPKEFIMYNNYPNPFNPSTKIKFDMPEPSFTKITIYDISGREVKTLVNENLRAGKYEINFDASGLSSGVYLYRMNSADFTQVKKMILVK
jgi:hypothetical protein